jgi:hypothetical protein
MRYFKLLFAGAVVLALSTVCSADINNSADVITNGGFETGDFTGWNTGGDLSMYWNLEVTPQAPHSGTDAAHFGAYGNLDPATLSQTFALLLPAGDLPGAGGQLLQHPDVRGL